MSRILFLIATGFSLTATVVYSQTPNKRTPVPNEKAIADAKKLVAEVYRDDYAKAKTLDQKLKLVERLLTDAKKTEDDPAGKYALLIVARDISTSAGDWEAALVVVDQLASAYQVDYVQQVDDARANIEKIDKPSRDARGAFLAVMTALQRAIASDRYDVAERMATSARKLARRVSNAQESKQLADRVPDLQKLKKQYDEVKESLATLQKSPTDPAANLAVGKFRCFVQERWSAGVSMLALSNDVAIAKVAQQELKQPTSANEQLAIGDGWWNIALADKDNQRVIKRHAVDCYLQVAPRLEGLAKKKAETRIAECEQWLSRDATYEASQVNPKEPPLLSLLNNVERFYDEAGNPYAFQIADAAGYIVIDLKREVPISRLYIYNRKINDRTRGTGVYFSSTLGERGEKVWTAPDNAKEWNITLPKLHTARYITIARDPGVNHNDGWLHLRKVKIYGPE